jgi:hypothetical protein
MCFTLGTSEDIIINIIIVTFKMNEDDTHGNDSNVPPTESRTKTYNTYMNMPLMRVGNVRPPATTQVPTNVEALVELKTHLEGENQQLRK